MGFQLDQTQLSYQDAVRKFAAKEVKPLALEYDQKSDPRDCLPTDLVDKGLEQGYHLMVVPEEYGGLGLGALTTVVILEELAAADAGFATTWHVNNIALTTLLNMGSDEEVGLFVEDIVRGKGGLAGLSTTEPDGGVTTMLLVEPADFEFRTRAELVGEEWVINGAKSFCSNPGLDQTKWAMVFCRVDMEKKGWASTRPIIVPMDAPGLTLGGEEDKMGHRLSSTQSLILDNVRVPKVNAIGAGGRAISGGVRRTTYEHDTAIAAISIGCARAAFEEALEWAMQRETGGKPIIKNQIIQAKIADMYLGLEAARAFAYRTADYSDSHRSMDVKQSRAVKVFASETANRVVNEAVQVLGGLGYCKGSLAEKCYRDLRVTTIYEGTNEAQRISISQLLEAEMAARLG